MSDIKSKIRKGTLLNRKMLSERVWEGRNILLLERCTQFLEDHCIKSCHVFLPITKNKEFDSWKLVNHMHTRNMEVIVSVSDFSDYSMKHFLCKADTAFEAVQFGIPEPVHAEPAQIDKVDMILIPLLAADKKGNRIGYGKGFYDRLLNPLSHNVIKTGISLAPLFDSFSFAEPHDAKLDFCITPFETYDFRD